MRFRRDDHAGSEVHDRRRRHKTTALRAACGLGLIALSLCAVTPCIADTIPAWLDDAIAVYNKANPSSQIQFVAIKDSYVWYSVPTSSERGSKEVRDAVYGIAEKNGYARTQDEEMVTTGNPPVVSGATKPRKCWTRSFLRNLEKGNSPKVQRMLTAMVCDSQTSWSAGFRIVQ